MYFRNYLSNLFGLFEEHKQTIKDKSLEETFTKSLLSNEMY